MMIQQFCDLGHVKHATRWIVYLKESLVYRVKRHARASNAAEDGEVDVNSGLSLSEYVKIYCRFVSAGNRTRCFSCVHSLCCYVESYTYDKDIT
eukprot:c25305_g2_i3 orf=1392-1673(+)